MEHPARRSRTRRDPQRVHASLLAGLLSHRLGAQGHASKNEYLGARSAKFAVFPGSALFKKPPRWVMSAELVETSRLWARVNARIEPEWVEPLAQHLVKRTYSEPHWEQKQAAVMAYEKVTLYGVPHRRPAQGRTTARIDPEVSRELFIRNALVEGDWRTHHQFFHDNRKLLGEVEELEHRARRRDILVDDETLFDFYDAAAARTRRVRRALRLLVEAEAPRGPGVAQLRELHADQRAGGGRSPRPTTRTPGGRAG